MVHYRLKKNRINGALSLKKIEEMVHYRFKNI